MSPVSEARKRANAKYNAKAYDRVEAKVPKGDKVVIQAHAEKYDGSLNKFMNRAISETIVRDNAAIGGSVKEESENVNATTK